jgi:hypothetical protein
MEGTRFFVKCLPIKSVEWVGASTNKDYAVAIDRIVYFDLNDPTDIYFLEDDEKFTELAGKTVR